MREKNTATLCILFTAALVTGCTVPPPGVFAAPPAVPVPIQTRSAIAAPSGTIANRLLQAHNVERAMVGVPALAWDPQLAASASAYAAQLARVGVLRHSNRQTRGGAGENLWMGTRGFFSPEQMVGTWASEKRMFRPGIFPNVSTTGNWADVGHYTQMIWRTTQRIGCGIASAGRTEFLVCHYAPKGNIDGRPVI